MKDARPITGGLLAAAAMIATGYASYPEVKDVDGDSSSPSHRKKRSKSSHKQNARKMQKRKK